MLRIYVAEVLVLSVLMVCIFVVAGIWYTIAAGCIYVLREIDAYASTKRDLEPRAQAETARED